MDPRLAAAVWCLSTLGHFLLTTRWINKAGTAENRDEAWFQAMIAGSASLSLALHLVSSIAGLSLALVLAVLLVGHGIAAWRVNLARLKPRPTPVARLRTVRQDLVTRILEAAAVLVLTAMVLQWTLLALPTAETIGSDAAHYHVPYAVNLALGASPFDLPPTQHLYPMGASMLAAWFLLPVETTLLTDLVMVLPFLLLLSAAGWLFRQLTSLSGLAWSTWMMFALFGTPLFRMASLMSADLLFAAATVALAATLLTPLLRRRLTRCDLWLISMSLGLLLGSKVTGIVVAALLGGSALVALVVLKLRGKWTGATKAPVWVWAGAALVALGAGGIWLVRNWWVWGSPVAPNGLTLFGVTLFRGVVYEPTMYLSVLGDVTEKPGYDAWNRARHFTEIWLGPWYLACVGALALIPIDALLSRRAGVFPSPAARLWTAFVICGTAAMITRFLIGAPWTSLEWTKGAALRYGLPWLALLPIAAWVALFPVSFPWYRRTVPAAVAGVAFAGGGLVILGSQPQMAFPPVPGTGSLLAAVAVLAALGAARMMSRGFDSAVATAAVLAVSVAFGSSTATADLAAQEKRAAAIARGPRSLGEQTYNAALEFEAREALSCPSGRRFFVTNRFDDPGALQGARLTNRVFYAARELSATAKVRPSMGACDYILTERAIMATDKGAALHAALNTSGTLVEVATVQDVVLLVRR